MITQQTTPVPENIGPGPESGELRSFTARREEIVARSLIEIWNAMMFGVSIEAYKKTIDAGKLFGTAVQSVVPVTTAESAGQKQPQEQANDPASVAKAHAESADELKQRLFG